MVHCQLKLSCKYYELSTENIQNENVHCQVIKQDVFKGVCEYEVYDFSCNLEKQHALVSVTYTKGCFPVMRFFHVRLMLHTRQ